jgi:toxin YoeB
MYKLKFFRQAEKDILYFKRKEPHLYRKIMLLVEELTLHPYTGTGHPEPLKYSLSGSWSRRINSEHRIVYKVVEDTVEVHVLTMRHHYGK